LIKYPLVSMSQKQGLIALIEQLLYNK
jgi:hypothetical protein